jgi:glyoxylase-like metal-dependent hydrolase (beta-lactamase superfamily II)
MSIKSTTTETGVSMIVRLEVYNPSLSDICFIEGIGLSSNVYTLGDASITLVDTGAGDPANHLMPKLMTLDLDPRNVEQVVLTHTHFDHTGGLGEIAASATPKILAHRSDMVELGTCGLDLVGLDEGAIIRTEKRELKVLHTSGHTSGSICLYDAEDKILLSGDTVFPDGSFGRTDLDGDERELIESLRRLSELDVEFLLPGHMRPIIGNATAHIQSSYQNARAWL